MVIKNVEELEEYLFILDFDLRLDFTYDSYYHKLIIEYRNVYIEVLLDFDLTQSDLEHLCSDTFTAWKYYIV